MEYTLDLPTHQVLGFYPDTGTWKTLSYTDNPTLNELKQIARSNPSCTMLRYEQYRYDCAKLLNTEYE